MILNGDPIDIELNEDFSNMSNDDIIVIINSIIGAYSITCGTYFYLEHI